MARKIFVKPGEGRKPRNLATGHRIPATGAWLADSPGNRRLLKCGDLVPASPDKPAKAKKPAKADADSTTA